MINWTELWRFRFKIFFLILGPAMIAGGKISSFCVEGKIQIIAGIIIIVIGLLLRKEENE